jgi:hypothetical protein
VKNKENHRFGGGGMSAALNAIACLPLVVLEFFVLLYAIEKVGSKNYSAIRAKKKTHNWLRRSFLRIPSSDDMAEQRE